MRVGSLVQEDPLEEGMAMHSSVLAWRIPYTEEPGRLQSIGSLESELKQLSMHTQNCYNTPDLHPGEKKLTGRMPNDWFFFFLSNMLIPPFLAIVQL